MQAECVGLSEFEEGECSGPSRGLENAGGNVGNTGVCRCAADLTPVCSQDGRTFTNMCEAACAGVLQVTAGACTTPLIPPPCICTREYVPVCSRDGRTFANQCMARCAGVTDYTPGECPPVPPYNAAPPPCICTLQYAPVCSKDGRTFANKCAARCAGVTDYTDGECPPVPPYSSPLLIGQRSRTTALQEEECRCSSNIQPEPVCGHDSNTYLNRCEAQCAGVNIVSSGNCTKEAAKNLRTSRAGEECNCLNDLNPVCGSNGVTYDNGCEADCAGVVGTKPGRCEQPRTRSCICSLRIEEVCGSDRVTYSNPCRARCAGVSYQPGRCPCVCGTIYRPVCGSDGVTYNNRCEAQCQGIEDFTWGRCPCPGPCNTIFSPVCGSNGITYENACLAQCAGVTYTRGRCRTCKCPPSYDPVCGSDGITYENRCTARCARVSSTPGRCPCICTLEFAPVCGEDGVTTYNNACEARCEGEEGFTPGRCSRGPGKAGQGNGENGKDNSPEIDFTKELEKIFQKGRK